MYLPISLFVSLCISMSIHPYYLCNYLPTYLSIHASICRFVYLSTHLSIYASNPLSNYPSIRSSIHRSTYLSITFLMEAFTSYLRVLANPKPIEFLCALIGSDGFGYRRVLVSFIELDRPLIGSVCFHGALHGFDRVSYVVFYRKRMVRYSNQTSWLRTSLQLVRWV